MAAKYHHLRVKAIALRTEKRMTLDEIAACLSLPKTTVYYWIKDIPIPRTKKQSEAQQRGTERSQQKYAALRDAAYQQGCDEAPELFQHLTFRDFVVLYMAEGYKRNRNTVSFVNSDVAMVKLAHRWMLELTTKTKVEYRLQYHADHDETELKVYWAEQLGIHSSQIKPMRKSNSNQLAGRKFRSVYGLLTITINDTYLRARLEAWMDYVKAEW